MFVSEDIFGTIDSLGGSVTDAATVVAGALVTVVALYFLVRIAGSPGKAIVGLILVGLAAAIFFGLDDVTGMFGETIDQANTSGNSEKATSD